MTGNFSGILGVGPLGRFALGYVPTSAPPTPSKPTSKGSTGGAFGGGRMPKVYEDDRRRIWPDGDEAQIAMVLALILAED